MNFGSALEQVHRRAPLVDCITNFVTVNDCANILLAVGGSPTMASDIREVQETAAAASALLCNLGAIDKVESMILGGQAANRAGKPVVFDPVGAGNTSLRRAESARLLDAATAFDLKISVCGYQETEGADPAVLPENMRPCRWTPKQFYMEHFVNATVAWGKLYSRSCFRDIRYPVGKIHEDEFVTYRLLFAQKEIAVVPAPLYAYFINPKGIIRSAWSPKRFHAWEAYDQQLAFFTAMGDEELVKFRVRGYLDNALANLYTAEQADNAAELTAEIGQIEEKIRRLIPLAWKHGCIDFWPDFDFLYRFFPLRTRAYRLWLEVRARLERKKDA